MIKNDGKKVWNTWEGEGAFFSSVRAPSAVLKGMTKPLSGCWGLLLAETPPLTETITEEQSLAEPAEL